jgi:RNA polymerase sigma-70 factor (ECF subfamily)
LDTPYDEADLLARIRAGDKAACGLCVEHHSNSLYRLALRLVENEAEAEDVVQETFLRAFKAIEAFEGRSSLGTWLYRITYNTAMMRLRKKEPDTISVDASITTADGDTIPRQLYDWCCLPEEDYGSLEARRELEAAIKALPPLYKPVFHLRELEGLSTAETAQVLDVSVEVVKTRLHRARLWLRERLAEYFTEYAAAKAEG